MAVSGAGIRDSTNELGWSVHLTKPRLAFRNLEFTIEGEQHASAPRRWLRRAGALLLSSAYAHPGHYAGGTIDGELAGDFLVDFATDDGRSLGQATLLAEKFDGGNLTFRAAPTADGLGTDDPILGHTAHLEGTATKDAQVITFTALVDVDDGTRMVGAPLDCDLRDEHPTTLGVQLLTIDPYENDTLLQKLDFGALDVDGDGALSIIPGSDGGNILRRTIQEHDHYFISATP